MLITVGLMMLILCWILVSDWGLVPEDVAGFVTGPGKAVSQPIHGYLVSELISQLLTYIWELGRGV